MYWNENEILQLQCNVGWIVTLDVLKLLNEYLNGDYTGSWIVTLDVLK